jgi:hypothetical protein
MLPPTEFHYFFAFLIASIENEKNPEQYTYLIDNAIGAVKELNKFYTDVHNQKKPDMTPLMSALEELIRSSKMQNLPHKIKKAVLAVCSILLGFTLGVIGAGAGLIGGLISDYTVKGNVINSGFGFLTGLIMGAFVGSRCSDLVFQSSFERKLEFCIMHISKVGKELAEKKTHEEYEAETKQYILDTFFNDTPEADKEAAFNKFLLSNDQSFQVSTTLAGFISPKLRGHLGHHSLIAYSINQKTHTPMEYGDRVKTPSFFAQNESPRIVTGKKLFEMLVLDRILQETYSYNLRGVAEDYDLGTNDCRTYVDKLLIGTNQAPTQLPRFNPIVDKPTGTYVIGPIVRFFSKTREHELLPLVPLYKANPNDPDPKLIETKWTKKKEPAPADENDFSQESMVSNSL